MMFQCEYFHYISVPNPAVHGVVLPYKSGDCKLVVLMTRSEKDSIEKGISALNAGALASWIEKAEAKTIRLTLPRLTLESELMELKTPLKEAGLDSLFSNNADLSGFSGRRDLKADRIIQKVKLEINERGTEAAAATMFACPEGGPPMKREIVDVSAQLTGKLLQREINEEDHKKLIDSFLSDLGD